ncbi:tRNA wybutosine-synthesizing protein 3-like protein [Thomasclavelia spiroformis]|uniref:tRNA wybutosine-synthesizing protein 3-like protein n=1 Tax=Thomasclavelia spiroformis TaxID=29348 RepID=UPI00399F0C13
MDKTLEKTARKKALTRNRPVRGKTRIIVKEHFSQQGKTMDELLTDVLMEKAKQTMP